MAWRLHGRRQAIISTNDDYLTDAYELISRRGSFN